MNYLILIAGFALLIKGADFFVAGSSAIAKRLGISTLVIGLTLVALGTSTPELIVSFMAALKNKTDIAIGNVVGSNIANTALVIGIAALLAPLRVQSSTIWKELPFSFLAGLALFVLANDTFFGGAASNAISRGDGLILLLFFSIFLSYVLHMAKYGQETKTVKAEFGERLEENIKKHDHVGFSLWKSISMTAFGIAVIIVGGQLVIEGASNIALSFGISETLIGLTIVAVGTSLPELVTSAVAAFRKEMDIAVGNVVGSNIFNVFFILGASALPHGIAYNTQLNIDIGIVLLTALLIFAIALVQKKIHRITGILSLTVYVGYLVFIIHRG